MEFVIKDNRIVKYVIVFGLAVVFLVIVMFFLGTNVQAVVIVDQAGGGDYLTIQEGVDNAIPGETVYVWDGTYNENITIDKTLVLIGNSSATTKINASGLGNHAVNITAEGVEVSGFNITNNETYYGIWTDVGGFDIHHNEFFTTQYAIYVDIYFLNPISIVVGDMYITDNTVAGGMGFHVNAINFDTPLPGSDIVVGQTIIDGNDLDYSGGWAIMLSGYGVLNMDGGSITWGDITVTNNILDTLSGNGIMFSGYLQNLTDVSAVIGDYDISGNNITHGGTGVQLDWWDFRELYGTTSAMAGQTLINDNNITGPSDGIKINFVNVGFNMYDTASVTIGDFIIDPNIINSGNFGIYLFLSNSAYEMHNDSLFLMGDVTIYSNEISDGGILFDLYQCAYNMYDNALAGFGNFFVTNNNVTSGGAAGIYFDWVEVGNYLYDNSRTTLGEVHVEDNQVDKIGGAGYALQVDPKSVGNYMYGDSYLTYGDWYVDGNTINSNKGGIHTGHQTSGYEMFDSSRVVFRDFYVRDNIVDADQSGINIQYDECGNYMRDFSRVIGGNMSVTGNNASSQNSYGYYVEHDEMGYYMYDQSYAEFGWFDTSFNNFSSVNSHGAYIDIYYLGAYTYGNSQAYFGAISIENNEFWSTISDGLYYYEFYENAYEMYDSSYVQIGDVLVNDNYVNAGGNGIYLDTWTENAFNMYQSASADLGNFEFNRNVIEAGIDGIYVNQVQNWAYNMFWDNHVTMGHWQFDDNEINTSGGVGIDIGGWYDIGDYMYGYSTFSMGNFEVLRNVINAVGGDGIDVTIEDLAYYNYGSSECYFGDFLFNDNEVNSTNYGIYIVLEYLAYYIYDSSYAEFGNFEVNNNDIIAGYGSILGYDGIYMYFYENGYQMYGNSQAYFGHLQMNDNVITSYDDDGINFNYFYEIAAFMYDNTYFEIGNVEVQRNWVDTADVGIYLDDFEYLAFYNYDNSQAHFGNFLFNENNITSFSHGILGEYFYYWGYELYNDADAYFGNVEFNNNTINAGDYGIRIGDPGSFSNGFHYWGGSLYSSNEVIFGHVQFNDNDILATGGDGINVHYFYDIGYEMYMTSYFYMENFEICRNTINAFEDGIEMYEIDELAYTMYDAAQAYFGDFLFNDNDIIAGDYGFYSVYIEYLAYDMNDNTYAEFGNFEFNRNTIISGMDGMYWYYGFYENAYQMEDSSRAMMGHYQINDNDIISTGGDGIYFYEFYEVGAYMLEDASFEMGNFEICRNVINASGTGIHVEEFEYIAYRLGYDGFTEYPGFTTFIMGDILVNDNTIVSGIEGINLEYLYYLGFEMYGNAYAEFGNFEVNRNHVTSLDGDGIYLYDWYEWGYDMYDSSEAVFGHVQVNDNNITAGNDTLAYDGIYMYEWYDIGINLYDLSSASFGNFEMSRNVINAGEDGIEIDSIEEFAYYNYDSSVCYYGDFLWNDNVITAGLAGSGDGIYINTIGSLAYELYDQSDAYFGNFELNRNIIHSYDTGIYVYNSDWGSYLYGDNEVIFGHFQINDNTINATDGGGIDMDYFYNIGSFMEGTSTFWMDNFEISRNNIITGNETFTGNDGIYMDIELLAYDNEDNARNHFGDFLFNDNVILAYGYGFNVDYFEYLGAYLCDTNLVGGCYAEFGNFEFNRNTITSLEDGIYVLYWEFWGYELYAESEVHFGHIQFNDNWILAGNDTTSSNGMYFSNGPAYEFAAYMYSNSYVTFENIEVSRNTVNSTDYGLYLTYYNNLGYYMFDSSRAEFQNFLVNENDIISGNDGIYSYEFYEVAAYMYDESYFIMGDFRVNDNVIEAGLGGFGDGIYLDDWGYNGYEMYNNAYAEFGNFEVSRNWIDPLGNGIYIYAYDWGKNMYESSYFRAGSWYVNDNTVVTASGAAMYLAFYEFAYQMYDYSRVYVGNLEVMRNTLNSTGGYGLEAWWAYRGLNQLYDYAYAEIGDCYLQYNDVTSWDIFDGSLYTGWDYPTDGVYDEAQAYLGDYYITHNTVYSAGTRGIDIYHEGLGIDLDAFNLGTSRSHVEVGDTWVTDNTITAPQGEGLHFLIGYAGYNVNYFSTVTVGGFYVERNIIQSMDYGIYVDMDDNGETVHDDARVQVGPVVVDGNDINSTGGTGIYLDANWIASDVTNNADVWLGDFIITNNYIVASDIGILFELGNSVVVADDASLRVPGLMVTGNVVDSPVSALNYTTYNTPGIVGINAVLEFGDVIISGNTFNGGIFGMAFDWQDPVPGVPQPVFYISYNDVMGGTVNSIGLYMMNIDTAYIETLSIDGYDQGIYVNNSNIWLMFNSTITNVPSYDMNLTSSSFIGAVNCTFDKADVYYEDDVSELKVGWFMNVLVITQAGYGVPGAHVVVGDVYGTITFDGSANTLGQAFYRIAWEYLENITGIIDTYNNHTADADKDSVFGFAVPDPLMDQTKLVIIVLGDSVPPNILGDTSDTFGTTGDPFNFGIDTSDNFGIYSVHVNYRFVGAGFWVNATMTGTGPFSLTINIPSSFVGTMRYYFSVQDVGGNWVSTGVVNIPITDNDAPTINADNSDSAATTGDIFNFIVDATDNIDVTEAHVVWWFDANPQTDDIMNGAGPYDFNVTVPSGSLDDLHYYFRVRDAAGNWIIGPQVNVTVTDNDAPTINADNSDTAATTGEQFFFDVDITDNTGVNATNLVYWFGINAPQTVPMNGTGPYTYNISVPTDSLDMLHYYFTAVDDAGNWFTGSQVDVTVSDNDAPTGLADTSDIQATTDDSFTFEVNATDNIGISDVYVVYWFGTGNQTNTSMGGTGPFDLGITIPSDSLDTLHYYFAITDADGNWLVGSQVDITVVDDDAPTTSSDDSDASATAGESFYFQVNATDNIGITEAYVIYWFDSGPEANATMVGLATFNRTVIIAPDAATLHYYFAIRDAAGNWAFGNQVNVDITGAVVPDDVAPTLDSDDSDTEAATGDSFEFDVTFTDNIGVAEIHVVYWFDAETPIDTIISGTYTITVPADSLDTLHYYFTAKDAAGNEYVGTQVDVDVTDNDAPFDLLDESDTTVTTGDTFTFTGNSVDNIGVTSAEVVFWFDSGAPTTATMTGDPFTYTITVPSGAGELHYYLVFYDAAGNSVGSQQKDIPVADNDPGSLSNDASDISGQEGEAFRFQVDASDNVGVSEVFAAYWFGDDEATKVFLPLTESDGTYSGSFVPSDHGTMNYYFMVVDSDGNEFEGNDNTASITEAGVAPGQVTKDDEVDVFPWILVVILVIVILLLLLLLMRKKGEEEPEAIAAEPEEGGGVEGEFGEEGLDAEPDEDLEEEPGEGLEEQLEAEEGAPILGEEEGLEEGLGEEPGMEEGKEPETEEGLEEEMMGEEEVIEQEPEGAVEGEEAPKEGEAGEGTQVGEITCPNCGIMSSADTEECPICRTKLG